MTPKIGNTQNSTHPPYLPQITPGTLCSRVSRFGGCLGPPGSRNVQPGVSEGVSRPCMRSAEPPRQSQAHLPPQASRNKRNNGKNPRRPPVYRRRRHTFSAPETLADLVSSELRSAGRRFCTTVAPPVHPRRSVTMASNGLIAYLRGIEPVPFPIVPFPVFGSAQRLTRIFRRCRRSRTPRPPKPSSAIVPGSGTGW